MTGRKSGPTFSPAQTSKEQKEKRKQKKGLEIN